MFILSKQFRTLAIAWGAGVTFGVLSANPVVGIAVAIALFAALD